ncbi:hypothetical protein ACN38_g12990 [Penicillium nordicum]|uniref:Uncharacterized protein n=1 Tax=Penicillium nordicum TaxID=229535 RepID=A0A0M8NXG4_9EURO|nr:hypothetical protein ACN38_g12990 [Penicillium nordicum]
MHLPDQVGAFLFRSKLAYCPQFQCLHYTSFLFGLFCQNSLTAHSFNVCIILLSYLVYFVKTRLLRAGSMFALYPLGGYKYPLLPPISLFFFLPSPHHSGSTSWFLLSTLQFFFSPLVLASGLYSTY